MDFTGVTFAPQESILEFNPTGGYADDCSAYGEIYTGENICPDTYSTADSIGDSFTDSYATTLDFVDAQDDNFDTGNGEFRETRVFLMDGGDQFSVSSTVFDPKEELIWAGNQGGHVTSYLSAETMKYTSFQVHDTEEIRDLKAIDSGILAITPTSLNMRTRQGIHIFTLSSPDFTDLQCMLPTNGYCSRLLLGGLQSNLIEYDLNKQEVIKRHSVGEEGCVILREHPRFICHGNTNGKVTLHDPRTLRQEHAFQAHSGTLSDFDAHGCYITTCGFSNRMGQMVGDQFVMVYDMRMMKMSLPLRALIPPYFLRIMPGLSPCLAAVSLIGQWAVMDAAQPEASLVSMNYQVSCPPESYVTSFDISSSSQALLFGDSHGSLHLFTTGAKPTFNNFSQETELPIVEEPPQSIPITDTTTPLSCIPLHYTNEPLLSDWPPSLMQTPYWSTPPIDPQILQAMRMVGVFGYAPNTMNKKRDQVPYKMSQHGSKSHFGEVQSGKNEDGALAVHVPIRYRRIEIKYSKMGLDEFDFDSYNRTSFSGLDMSLPNSYCNPMLQVFYYIAPLRVAILSHLCEKEFCLACELSFLFHMLDINMGQGIPCHASNFLRTFRTLPEASAMSLTISDQDNRSRINFASKIQSWNCFVLQQLHSETFEIKEKDLYFLRENFPYVNDHIMYARSDLRTCSDPPDKPETSSVSEIFGANITSINKCTRCCHQVEKDIMSLTLNLSFHESASELSQGSLPFGTVVQNSLCSRQITQAWCDTCAKYQPMEQFRKFKSLPSVIAMNCGLDSSQDIRFWQKQHEYLLTEVREKLKDEAKEFRDAEKSNKTEDNHAASPVSDKRRPETYKQHASSPMKTPVKGRRCRYGTSCVRVGCHFWHPMREKDDPSDQQILSILDQTMEYSWIPHGLKAKLEEDQSVLITNINKHEKDTIVDDEDGNVYDLMGVISHVADPKFPDKNNLVACIKVGPSYHQRANVSPVAHWYLFNDISISPITSEEALWFPCGWKTPCVLYWVRRNLDPHLGSVRETNPITFDVFREDKSLAQRGRKRITFTPLTADEIPNEGELVAMDAEFVNLHQEEAEIRSDGTRTTIKPSQKSVARITCIRGQGPLAGTPFLDDYISTQEQVVDYLTQFSGIKPGDLDANYSQKHLTTLKSTYVKLRYLIDRGVKVVGHGLKNDFRVINMVVPQNQLIDTVHLFHMPHCRMVSLKFLAWYFLKLKIQSITHDSIEDAKTALALYHEYLFIVKRDGKIVIELQKMYEVGKKLQWKVPGEEDE